MTAKEILAKAASFIGITEDPKGSNKVPFVKDYFGYIPSNAAEYAPWCVIFVWDVFRLAGASELFFDGKKVGSCTLVWNWAKANKLVVTDPRPGDLVLFDWNGDKTVDHIGFVEEAHETTLTCIEGNCDDAVKRTVRKKSLAHVYIRPKYSAPEIAGNCAECPLRSALLELYNRLKEENNK